MPNLLAFVGSGVLLIGVALLLILARHPGNIDRALPIVACGLLAVALVAVAFRVRRNDELNIGAMALAATGFAAAYLDVVAVTSLYGLVQRPLGLAIAGTIALLGLFLAVGWHSEAFGVICVLGALVLVPLLSRDPTTALAFLVVMTLVTFAFQWGRNWSGLLLARTVPTALTAIVVALMIGTGDPDRWLLVTAAILLAVLSVVSSIASVRGRPDRPEPYPLIVGMNALLLPLLVAPALVTGVRLERAPGVLLLAAIAVLLITLGALGHPLPEPVRPAAAAVGAVAGLMTMLRATDFRWLTALAFLVAVAYLAVARAASDRIAFWLGAGAASLGALSSLPWLAGLASLRVARERFGPDTVLGAATAVAVAVLFVSCVRRRRGRTPAHPPRPGHAAGDWVGYLGWVAAIVAFTVCVVAGGTWVGDLLGSSETGFRGGHALATVAWFAGSGYLLLTGLRHTGLFRRRFGLILAGAAVMKLMLFDLAALSGLARVLAFMMAGLLLIVIGAAYAKALGSARSRPPGPPIA